MQVESLENQHCFTMSTLFTNSPDVECDTLSTLKLSSNECINELSSEYRRAAMTKFGVDENLNKSPAAP